MDDIANVLWYLKVVAEKNVSDQFHVIGHAIETCLMVLDIILAKFVIKRTTDGFQKRSEKWI